MRILFLAFEFPPLTTAGVFRAAQFASGLAREGCSVDVVTVRAEDYAPWTGTPLDWNLLGTVNDAVRVHRIASGFPAWYWSLRASRVGSWAAHYGYFGDPVAHFWRGPLSSALDAVVRQARPDVLLATAPPFGVAVLAREAARRYQIPWVLDWRDPWTLWRSGPFPSYAHFRAARAQEGRLLRGANASVTTSHVTRDEWIRMLPGLDAGRLAVVHTGYNAAELLGLTREAVPCAPAADRVRRIVYVGNFYYDPAARPTLARRGRRSLGQHLSYTPEQQDWLYRSPYFFLRGLQRAVVRRPNTARRFRVELAGPIPEWLPSMLATTGTTDLVNIAGPVPHAEAVRAQASADALLLTSALRITRDARPGRDYSVAGKLSEYFGLRRPILGVLTNGAMRDLVDRSGLGLLADPDDADAIADQIIRIADASEPAALLQPNDAFLESFDERYTVGQMATVLRHASQEGYRE